MAASNIQHDPLETADQDDHLEIRAEAAMSSRAQELYAAFVLEVERRHPDDKERQDELKKGFMDEQRRLKREQQEREQTEKEEEISK